MLTFITQVMGLFQQRPGCKINIISSQSQRNSLAKWNLAIIYLFYTNKFSDFGE